MTDFITPIRIVPVPDRLIRGRRRRPPGVRLGLLACELMSLAALVAILAPRAADVRLPGVSRFLSGWPDLRDAQATCQQFVRETNSRLRDRTTGTQARGGWSWRRLEDGRFRILGSMDGRSRSGKVRRTRYQCDMAPLSSDGRWRVDSLAVSRGPPS
jgi:hypothetical protein